MCLIRLFFQRVNIRRIVRGPELLSKYLGDSEKAVQALFKRARSVAPAVVFFDEIDSLAGKRSVYIHCWLSLLCHQCVVFYTLCCTVLLEGQVGQV